MKKIGSLKTIGDTRNQLTRVIKAYHLGEIPAVDFRNLVYSFSVLLSFQKSEAETELLERMDRLENRLGMGK